MPAVSDTSPILGLSAIGHLELLQQQFGAVLIPSAVLTELKIETDFRGTASIRKAIESGWLEPREVQNILLIMDEHDGRIKARALGLKPVGILGVLLRAKQEGRIKSLKQTMQALQREVGFFISDDLYQQVLKQAKE